MLTEDEARQQAATTLRFEIGTRPHLGELLYSAEEELYSAPIMISYPRVAEGENDGVEFDHPEMVGEIRIDAVSGEASHTPLDILDERIKHIKSRSPDERQRHPLSEE